MCSSDLFDLNGETEITSEIDEGCDITWESSDTGIATVKADSRDASKAIVTGIKEGEVTITLKATKNGENVEKSVKRNVVANYKNKPIKLDLSTTESDAGATIDKNSDGSITIKGTTGGAGPKLPYELHTDDKIKVTVKGIFPENDTKGFRFYPSWNWYSGGANTTFGPLTLNGYTGAAWQVGGDEGVAYQKSLCTVNKEDRTFTVEGMEFTGVGGTSTVLLLRNPCDGLTITEITVTYL